MKIYTFHRIIPGLNPLLYGFTEDPEIAEIFNKIRKNMYLKELDLSRKEYMEFRDAHKELRIRMNAFWSKNPYGIGRIKILQPTTEREYAEFVIHKEMVLTTMLAGFTFPIEVFSKSFQKCLSMIYFDVLHHFYEELESLPFDWDSINLDLDWTIDEFEVFVIMHRDTIK